MTNSLADNLYTLGTAMATNLVEMGVTDADPDDGLTTLAGKILDIEPSISGLDLDTAVTLTASSASIVVGNSVTLTSKLTASYDDETLVNVDLSGVLTGATILFKEGNTQIGSGVTDSTGTATATISGLTVGSHTIKAVFAGTENFDDCESTTVTVVVSNPAPDSMTLVKSAGKQILSYADVSGGDEYCTVKATVYDANDNPLAGETVTFSIGGTTVKSDVTDSNGEITYTYNSQGSGDVTITAECSLVSETYDVCDAMFYDDCSTNKVSSYTRRLGSSSLNYNSDGYLTTTESPNEGWLVFSPSEALSTNSNWSFEAKIKQTNYPNNLFHSLNIVQKTNNSNHISLCLYKENFASYGYGSPNTYLIPADSSVTSIGNNWYRLKCELKNGTIYIKIYNDNDVQIYSNSLSLPSNYQNIEVYPCFGGYYGSSIRQYKDILLKPL